MKKLVISFCMFVCGLDQNLVLGCQADQMIRISTRLVVVDVQVLNKSTQRAIGDLQADDFLVYENGVLQKVTNFSRDQLSLSLVLLFDMTWSLHPVLQHLAITASEVLSSLKSQDEVAVITFGRTATLLQRFTIDRQRVTAAIQRVAMQDPVDLPEVKGSAQLNEAIYQAAAYAKAQATSGRRRVIIILNDGLSNAAFKSSHSEKEAFAQLSESDATVCGLIDGSRRSDVARAATLFHGLRSYAL